MLLSWVRQLVHATEHLAAQPGALGHLSPVGTGLVPISGAWPRVCGAAAGGITQLLLSARRAGSSLCPVPAVGIFGQVK